MRLFLFSLLTLSLTPMAKATVCTGSGYLQNMPVYVWNIQFFSCKAQGLLCFKSDVANEGFRQRINMALRFQGNRNFIVVGDNPFAKDGSGGFLEIDSKTGERRLYIEDQQKTRRIDFSFKCVAPDTGQ